MTDNDSHTTGSAALTITERPRETTVRVGGTAWAWVFVAAGLVSFGLAASPGEEQRVVPLVVGGVFLLAGLAMASSGQVVFDFQRREVRTTRLLGPLRRTHRFDAEALRRISVGMQPRVRHRGGPRTAILQLHTDEGRRTVLSWTDDEQATPRVEAVANEAAERFALDPHAVSDGPIRVIAKDRLASAFVGLMILPMPVFFGFFAWETVESSLGRGGLGAGDTCSLLICLIGSVPVLIATLLAAVLILGAEWSTLWVDRTRRELRATRYSPCGFRRVRLPVDEIVELELRQISKTKKTPPLQLVAISEHPSRETPLTNSFGSVTAEGKAAKYARAIVEEVEELTGRRIVVMRLDSEGVAAS